MKKLIVVLGVVAFGFAFTACKKDCKCKATLDGVDVIPEASVGEMSKSDCESHTLDVSLFEGAKIECKSE